MRPPLASKMVTVIDLITRLPVEIWFCDNPKRSDAKFEAALLALVSAKTLPADLYRRRWRIEQAFSTVKRLLGLSYLWTGSINGVKLQIWATWLFFAVLVDLDDAARG